VEPPKPRFSTGSPGKSAASEVQRRIDELPKNTMPPGAGIDARSAASNARISTSKRSRPRGAGDASNVRGVEVAGGAAGVDAHATSASSRKDELARLT
jgi:hypothetical protein